MESHALLVVVYCFIPFRVYQSDLFPAVEDRRPYLTIDPIIVEEEGLLGLDLSLEFLEITEKSFADELPVVDHLGVALACGGFASRVSRAIEQDAAPHACSPAPRIKSRGNPPRPPLPGRGGAL